MDNQEIWYDVKGYEGWYQVSNMGRVKSLERVDRLGRRVNEKILSPGKHVNGYLFVHLWKGGERKMYDVHRLVLMTFNPCDNMKSLQVNHINEFKDDNRLENLEWCTALYNLTYNDRHKRVGEKNTNGKKSIPVVQLTLEEKFVKAYKSSHDAQRLGGFTQQSVNACCKNKFNREGNNIYKGFKWMYLSEYLDKNCGIIE